MKINKKIIRLKLKQFAKSIFYCERSVAILLALALVLSLGIMALPMAETVEASPGSYTTSGGKACWSYSLDITKTPLSWSPLAVDVSYADGKATFVITAPVAFDPEAWPNDNFWLSFDTNIDGAEDFQVGYNTREPGTEMGGWPEHPTEHWFYKFGGSWYQLIPDDWDVFETGLSEFTVSIPVSYLGGANSNYEFQIGLVKWVYETDWQAEWGNVEFDPICEGWSTSALIFVPLPAEGWESETIPAPKVTITKIGPATAKQGKNITYTINYKNEGTFSATNVVITETYPSEVEYVSATPAPDSGTSNQWTIGTLAPGVEGTITVTVHIK